MNQGDIVIAVLSGDYGKPRPTVLVQSHALLDSESLLLCPLTSDVSTAGPFRLEIQATSDNGLQQASVAMTDKITAVPRRRCREVVGRLAEAEVKAIDAGLIFVFGLDS